MIHGAICYHENLRCPPSAMPPPWNWNRTMMVNPLRKPYFLAWMPLGGRKNHWKCSWYHQGWKHNMGGWSWFKLIPSTFFRIPIWKYFVADGKHATTKRSIMFHVSGIKQPHGKHMFGICLKHTTHFGKESIPLSNGSCLDIFYIGHM